MRWSIGLLAALLLVTGCGADARTSPEARTAPETLTVEVVETFEHDRSAFTQGLLMDGDDVVWESTGRRGESDVRRVDLATGRIEQIVELDDDLFGEGLAAVDDTLVQLTWTSGQAIVRSADDLSEIRRLDYDGEGWGLTLDEERGELLMSDGSSTVTRRDPVTFEVRGSFDVRRRGEPVERLNELEWVDGVLWANVWYSDEILRVDPSSGVVTGVVDASSLFDSEDRTAEMTLNGIAHRRSDPPTRLVVTGKLWPRIHVVDVVPS